MQKYHLKNRPDREITSDSEIKNLLKKGKYCIVSLCRNNEPYIVTLSYGYDESEGALFVHCAAEGQKIDFIRANPNVCATIIEDGGYVVGECAHNYRTVVLRGDMHIVDNIDEKRRGMRVLLEQLENGAEVIEQKLQKSESFYTGMQVLRLDIKELHAKAGR